MDNFELYKSSDISKRGTSVLDIVLKPEVIVPVYVLFSPTTTKPVRGKIVMKSEQSDRKYTVRSPLLTLSHSKRPKLYANLAFQSAIGLILKQFCSLTLYISETKIFELANSIDPDEWANKQLLQTDLHCLPSSF